MMGFDKRRSANDDYLKASSFIGAELDNTQLLRLEKIRRNWNFYEGYHWEGIPQGDAPEITINYCRAFVDKFVSFELGKAFTFSTHKNIAEKEVTNDGRTLFEYLEDVWEDNEQYLFVVEMGQMKSITGEAWVQVKFSDAEEIVDVDHFNEYPDGRLEMLLMPTGVVFPTFDPHRVGKLISLSIIYAYERLVPTGLLQKKFKKEQTIFKQIWTAEDITTIDGKDEPVIVPNKYGIIPFVQIKNLPIAGRNEGRNDLDDIIPMNMEFDMKKSNFSEILDYHASPVTIVYGAKVGNLEKGANKMWGGLAKDARVENLELNSDLSSSATYSQDLKTAMCEVGSIPETVLGGAQAISNTSGVALQYLNLPLIEKTRVKIACTENGLESLHKLIILISMLEGLITKPEEVTTRDFFNTEVKIPDTLPKDELMELQQIQVEMKLGLESREGALKRMGRENIESILKKVAEDKEEDLQHEVKLQEATAKISPPTTAPNLNSGMTNSQTPVEQVRIETTGKNG